MMNSNNTTNDSQAASRPERGSNTASSMEANPADFDLSNRESQLQTAQPQDSATKGLPSDTTGTARSQMAESSPSTETGNPKDAIEPFDWEQLEVRYLRKMSECEQTEQAIYEEFNCWIKVNGLLITETLQYVLICIKGF